jgi:DNA invertase Pin-like site-specific DNA recombinase
MRASKLKNTKAAVGYVRVSTDEQQLGPEAQRRALERHCKAHGLRLVAVLDDLGASGGLDLDKRPGFMAALEQLRTHGAGVLLVHRRDRLARKVELAVAATRLVEREGATVHAVEGVSNDATPEGELMRNIADAFAQYERALISTRTRAALAVKKARGERTGQVPYGWRATADGRLEPHEPEQLVLRRIRRMHAHSSTRAIAAKLNAEGLPARGARWHQTTVMRLLARARLAASR